MSILDESRGTEYSTVHAAMRDVDRTWQACWTASMLVACILLAWGISARNPAFMLPVILAVALGFTSMFQGRRDVRLMAGYLANYAERSPGNPRWFTRLSRLSSVPGFSGENDWVLVGIAYALTTCSVALAWWFAADAPHGEIVAGIATGGGIVFLFHSYTQLAQMLRATDANVWRQAERLSGESGGRDTAAAA